MASARATLTLLLCLGAACTTVREPSLFDVTGVEQSELSRGQSLRVAGLGFPVQRQGEVVLASPALRLRLPARAILPDLLVATIDDATFEALRAGFAGSLTVRFADVFGGHVTGRLPRVRLTVVPPAPASVSRRDGPLALSPRALRLCAALTFLLVALSLAGPLGSPALWGARLRRWPMWRGARASLARSALEAACVLVASLACVRGSWSVFVPALSYLMLALLLRARRPARELVVLGAHALGLLLALALGAALPGTSALPEIAAQQGALPWQWQALGTPHLLLDAGLYVYCAARVCDGLGERVALLASGRAVLAVLGAWVFFGAGQLSAADSGAPLSALVLSGKGLVVAAVVSRVQAHRLRVRVPALLAAYGAVALLDALWLWQTPPAWLQQCFGLALAASALCVLGAGLAGAVLGERREEAL